MQGKAEDAGGLTPAKDENEAMRKSGPKANAMFWLDGVLDGGSISKDRKKGLLLMMEQVYLRRLSRTARWRLPPKDAADVIEDYSQLLAIDPRPYETQCRDYGTPKHAVRQLTVPGEYARWLAVFFLLALCPLLPVVWLGLQFFNIWFAIPQACFLALLVVGAVLSAVWFRREGERYEELPPGLAPQLLLLLMLGTCVAFLAGICFSPALLELGTAYPDHRIGYVMYLLLCCICGFSGLVALVSLVRARLGDRRWTGVYVLGLTVLLVTLFLLSALSSMTLDGGELWWVPCARRMGIAAAAGLVGTGVALC